ncbi:hypothetical protein V3G39_12025 [Dermatophilaceae bacterium Sec6.4]|nr:hypothetical protein [Actinomycetota bacterium]
MSYALSTTIRQPFAATVQATRDAPADQAFGVLTEIDLAAALKAKIDEHIAPQVMLGPCPTSPPTPATD